GRLAEYDRGSQPTMAGAVAGLVARVWVTKEPDPEDARAALVTLTEAGREALAVVRRRNAEAIAAAVTDHPHLSPDDLATAVSVLRELLEATSQKGMK
ncbi:MAG: hypothetical protein L0H93_08335, partial [Nocardioides sp.]|nr:hypothetical protein [Nocardioides sp.]